MSVTCGWSVVFSTNKTDRQVITEILLKVAFNTINQPFSKARFFLQAIRVFTHQARKGSITGHAVPGQELHMLEAAHRNKTHQLR